MRRSVATIDAPIKSGQNVPRLAAAPAVRGGRLSHRHTEKLDVGLSLQRIWQDLVEEYGYGASYESVKRFVRTLAPTRRAVGIFHCAPGAECTEPRPRTPPGDSVDCVLSGAIARRSGPVCGRAGAASAKTSGCSSVTGGQAGGRQGMDGALVLPCARLPGGARFCPNRKERECTTM